MGLALETITVLVDPVQGKENRVIDPLRRVDRRYDPLLDFFILEIGEICLKGNEHGCKGRAKGEFMGHPAP